MFLTTFRTFPPRGSTTIGSFQHFQQENKVCREPFAKSSAHFLRKHRYFIVFHSFHEFSTGKTPGNGGKPVFLWKRGTCRGAGPWLRLYLVYKRFIFAPCIAGCERWKNKSFQHHCGKRCGKSLAGEQETAGAPSGPFRPALRSHKSQKAAARTGAAAFFNTVV